MRNKSVLSLVGAVVLGAVVLGANVLSAEVPQQAAPFLGAWNIAGTGPDANAIYWLEVKDEGGKLSALFLNRTGHPLPVAIVKVEGNELVFQNANANGPTGPEYRAHIENGKLIGHHTLTMRARNGGSGGTGATNPPAAPTTREVNWVGVRPPTWPAANANAAHTFGTPVVLFDSTDAAKRSPLDQIWTVQNTNRPMGWSVDADGYLANEAPGGNNLISKQKFGDFKVEIEYKLEPKSNSGIYLRGRYELQVLDDLGDTTTEPFLTQMAVYGRTAPLVRASKAPGEWQSMDATVVANKVTVHLNGQTVQNNTTIGGVTGGTLDNDELAPGPLMIQGDHGHVWIRKIVVTPIVK